MSDDLQRIIGALQAQVDNLTRRVARTENAFIAIGMAAVGLVGAAIAKSAGLF